MREDVRKKIKKTGGTSEKKIQRYNVSLLKFTPKILESDSLYFVCNTIVGSLTH